MNNPFRHKKILFLGDSITYAGLYVAYAETYLRLQFPGESIDIVNCGLSSETVSGLSEENHAGGAFARPDLHERLERVLVQVKPDLVIACYGMNDGIYQPFGEDRFQAFQSGMRRLHERVVRQGGLIVHLTPPPFDDVGGKLPFYAEVLRREAEWLQGQASEEWVVFDLHGPMSTYLAEQKQKAPEFVLAEDGVHPGSLGHWLMARELLQGLGFSGVRQLESIESVTRLHPRGSEVLELVQQRQELLRNAWLTTTGHSRPGVPEGLSLNEAEEKADFGDESIRNLLMPASCLPRRA